MVLQHHLTMMKKSHPSISKYCNNYQLEESYRQTCTNRLYQRHSVQIVRQIPEIQRCLWTLHGWSRHSWTKHKAIVSIAWHLNKIFVLFSNLYMWYWGARYCKCCTLEVPQCLFLPWQADLFWHALFFLCSGSLPQYPGQPEWVMSILMVNLPTVTSITRSHLWDACQHLSWEHLLILLECWLL